MIESILREIRIYLGDVEHILVEAVPADLEDDYLLEYIDTANNHISAYGIFPEPGYVVNKVTPSISPDPLYIDVLLIASHAAYLIISTDLAKRVRSGELGVRFKTGQDEISTVEASRQIKDASRESAREFRRFVVAKLSDNAGGYERVS